MSCQNRRSKYFKFHVIYFLQNSKKGKPITKSLPLRYPKTQCFKNYVEIWSNADIETLKKLEPLLIPPFEEDDWKILIRICRNTPPLVVAERRSCPPGLQWWQARVDRAEAHHREGGLIRLYHVKVGKFTAQFHFDSPRSLLRGASFFFNHIYNVVKSPEAIGV